MPSDWQVKIGGKVVGPLDDARIKQLVTQGAITPETLVCVAAQGRWVPARLVKGLFLSGEAIPQAPVKQPLPAPPRRPVAATTPLPPPRVAVPRPAAVNQVEMPPLPPPVVQPTDDFDFLGAGQAPSRPAPRGTRRPTGRRGQGRTDGSLNVILGAIGTGLLVLGLFCPIISLPVVGGVSYVRIVIQQFQNASVNEIGVASLIAILAAGSGVVAALMRKRTMFWGPGVAGSMAVVLTIASYMRLQARMAQDIDRDLGDNPFRGLAQAMAQSVSLDFGLGLVTIGAGLLIAAAVMPEKQVSR